MKGKNIIWIWALISIAFALGIHCLFSFNTSISWLQAKWEAGDILTYASTVALGLLAIWQNQRFKDENDTSQKRLEKLTVQANELSVISKIIDREGENLDNLKSSLDMFSYACDPQTISREYANTCDDVLKLITKMVELESNIDRSFFKLARELRIDPKVKSNDETPIKKSMVIYYMAAKQLVEQIKQIPSGNVNKELDALVKIRNDFMKEGESYCVQQEEKLSKVIYGNLMLEEIRKLYKD